MTNLITPPVPPGAFGLTRIGGLSGRIIGAMQGAAGHGAAYTHAFLVLDHGEVIEAEPGVAGARIVPLQTYLDRQTADDTAVVFCDAPIRRQLDTLGGGDPDGLVEAALRRMVVAAGRSLETTPYSLLDYVWLAQLHTLGAGTPRWLARRVEATGHLICSQLVDRAYQLAGVHLFADDRFAGDVMPADLAQYREEWLEQLAGAGA